MITLTERLFPQATLSLYLGGTGILAGDRLLSMLESVSPAERAYVEPFFIDSQEPRVQDHARARHYCYSDLTQFFQPIYREFTAQRFPENLGVSPVMNSCEGCGVTRIFGAASLVSCRDDFSNLIEQAVARLKKARTASTQPLQVFITASACGGTGAGMIVDAAALVRHFFRARAENPRIFLFLIGPSVYFEDPMISLRPDQRDRMSASTYALLKELHHFAQGHPFTSSYRLRDEPIEISNASDDDRLFEWVYLIDGHGEKDGATRSLDETLWMLAETQFHLALTEVGRKVAETMPNQREERLREYAQHFIHPDNKEGMSDEARRHLEAASRKTFLASFSVRNVRFPAGELKSFFRARWTRDALQKVLVRENSDPELPEIDQFDALLGHDRGTIAHDGFLARVGLTREQISSRVTGDADPARGIPAAPPREATPDRAMKDATQLVDAAAWVLEDLTESASLVPGRTPADRGRLASTRTLVAQALEGWTEIWNRERDGEGEISAWLVRRACSPTDNIGRGLRFVDAFLRHTTRVLTQLAGTATATPSLTTLKDEIEEVEEQLALVRQTTVRERRGFGYVARKWTSKLKSASPDSETLLNRTRTLLQRAAGLRQQLIAHRDAQLAFALAPTAWLLAADELRRWRENVLAPMIVAAENALTLAENRYLLAKRALNTFQGTNARGAWFAHSTVQIAGDELLAALSKKIEDVSIESIALAPLVDTGISREQERLTLRTLASIDRQTAVAMLDGHIEGATRGRLTFLDNGWMIPEVAAELRTSAARVLDEGAEPLVNFSRSAVGVSLLSYFIAPASLIVPRPFGRAIDSMNRLTSTDPLQLGVASFAFGIPPNALNTMRELFEQYVIHLGDQQRNRAPDRYPLHVFRDAAEHFDEPYSPLLFDAGDAIAASVIDAAHELWADGILLHIREFDHSSQHHRRDTNRMIELTEKVLHALERSPHAAQRLFDNGRFTYLQHLYDTRRFRPSHAPGSNGGA
jgi:hypothetical protein